MEITIKYSIKDYLVAIKYKMSYLLSEIKDDGKYFSYAIMLLIKPFVTYGITIYAYFTKLKPEYQFIFDEKGMTRKHNNQTASLVWDRFHNFRESPELFLIEFTKKGEGIASHVLIPKRMLQSSQINEFKELLSENNIFEA